jgi:hypothetical protein
MMMADDDHSAKQAEARGELGWGGTRQKRWHMVGKRAVVNVDPQVYEIVTVLAKLCLRPGRDLCSQIFALGLESLTGHNIRDLRMRKFMVELEGTRQRTKAFTHDEVRERVKLLKMLPEEVLEYDPEFDDSPEPAGDR